MDTDHAFQDFRKALQQALSHLFDPDYHVPEVLYNLIPEGPGINHALRTLLVREIEALKLDDTSSGTTRTQRSYNILKLRYIDGHSQESTAENLQMSLRSLQRAQRQAVLVLAHHLWTTIIPEQQPDYTASSPTGWRSQLDQEINLYTRQAPDARANLYEVLESVNHITLARSPQRYRLQISLIENKLSSTFHAPVLQQILLSLLDAIMDRAPSEVMDIQVRPSGNQKIRIEITGGLPVRDAPLDLVLVESLLSMQEGCEIAVSSNDPLTVYVDIPMEGETQPCCTILFVDDNADLASLFTSYCTGTDFELVHVAQGSKVRQSIQEIHPDLIILDVMLPDVDGWELLISLKADPVTENIPIIVCSVITDADLAVDLGAALYLQKPVWRQRFLDAVTSVTNQSALHLDS